MKKKILIAISIFVVAIVAMGAASAFEFPDLGSIFGMKPDQNVTIDGVTFHVPGSYKENLNVSKNATVEDYNIFKVTNYAKGFIDDKSHINILISDYNGITVDSNLINYMNGTAKNINGTDGYLHHDGISYTFSYKKDNKVISIQTEKEDLIAKVIA